MIAPFTAACPSCGAADARREANPGIGVGYAVMGVFLIHIAFAVEWYGGVGVMHQVLGWGLALSATWGLIQDGRALATGAPTSRFWIETRSRCDACGATTRYATAQRVTRVLLLATFAIFAYLRFAPPSV